MGKMAGGGAESSVMNYYAHIDKNRINYDFIVDSDSTHIPRKTIESQGGRVIEVPPYQQILENQKALRELFENEHYPIVHSHLNTLSVFPLYAAKRAGVPVRIAHSHATMGKGEFNRNNIKRILRLFSNLYPTDRAACSKYAGTWLFGSNRKFVIIPNAIDLREFSYSSIRRNRTRKSLGFGSDDILIGHVGRLEKTKNQVFAIKVFEQIRQSYNNAKLVLVGDGKQRSSLMNQVSNMGLCDSVIFLGQRDDISDLYQAFDLFLFPSLYEGFGMALLEAQKSGVNCIASDCVPDEVVLTNWCQTLPLSCGPEKWAELANGALKRGNKNRLIRTEDNAFNSYDILGATIRLEEYYETLASSSSEE